MGVATRKSRKPVEPPVPLGRVEVDIKTRLGVVSPPTTTGLRALDDFLGGGLRAGVHLVLSGEPGVGKTALALMLAYMAARARAGVLYASVALDDTEVMARLAARALHREYNNVDATYGTLWNGEALQDDALRAPIAGCVASVSKKVGTQLHLHSAAPMESTGTLAAKAGQLFSRNERVVVVVDGLEGFSASGSGSTRKAELANASYDGRLSMAAQELFVLARSGCAVITTCQVDTARLAGSSATVLAELRGVTGAVPKRRDRGKLSFETQPRDVVIVKNRFGRTGSVPLSFFPAGSVFEERAS